MHWWVLEGDSVGRGWVCLCGWLRARLCGGVFCDGCGGEVKAGCDGVEGDVVRDSLGSVVARVGSDGEPSCGVYSGAFGECFSNVFGELVPCCGAEKHGFAVVPLGAVFSAWCDGDGDVCDGGSCLRPA